MSSKVTINQSKGVRVVGLIAIIAGIFFIVAGGTAYYLVHDQLKAEKITVSSDADFLAGKPVQGPLSAYAQAEVINKHALESSGGKTYAELDKDDPVRATVMNGSFLRASLFTSVVAFGVSLLVAGLGVLFVLVGWALRRVASGPGVVVESFDTPSVVGSHVSSARTDDVPDVAAPVRTPAHAAPVVAPVAAPVVAAAQAAPASSLTEALDRHVAAAPVEATPVETVTVAAEPVTPADEEAVTEPAADVPEVVTAAEAAEPVVGAPSQWESPADRVSEESRDSDDK